MISDADASDCINLTALSLEVWFNTYCVDGIRAENSEYALSLFTEERFRQILDDDRYRLLVFTQEVYLRGYILVNLDARFEGRDLGFEIDKLYVQVPFQGQGIGRALLDEARARYGNRFWLYTWVKNKSMEFYKHLGFRDIGRYEFQLGEDRIENRVLAFRDGGNGIEGRGNEGTGIKN